MSEFDPQNVKRCFLSEEFIGGEGYVLAADYDQLLARYLMMDRQMTLAERYGTIEVK